MKIESFLFDGQLRLLIGLSNDNFADFVTVLFFDLLDQIKTFVCQKLRTKEKQHQSSVKDFVIYFDQSTSVESKIEVTEDHKRYRLTMRIQG